MRCLYWCGVLAVLGLMVLFLGGLYLARDLPNLSELKAKPADPSIVIVARDGSTIATFGDIHGQWLTFDEFPEPLLQALIATEDRRFFTHPGFDLKGLLRAAVKNVAAGRVVEGGSTITQQVAKNLFLTSERTTRRKIQELMIAFWLETKMSKKEIITLYLNRMYFGARSYGVDAASQTYFGHSGRQMNLSEAAMLVGLLKAPSALTPTRDYPAAVARSHEVLGAMVEADIITRDVADKARKSPPKVRRTAGSVEARYFADYVIEQLPVDVRKLKEPLIVRTTLDPKAQTAAERALRTSLNSDGIPGNINQGAIVVMGTDGSILAMVGGKSYAESQFNRAVQAQRQPGSAFKLFVYLAALEQGIDPDSYMRDTPIILDGWSPENYKRTFEGEVTLRHAFAQSLNTVAVKLSERVDRHQVVALAHRMGIKSKLNPTPSIALGTSEVNLLELTSAYAVVGNNGYSVMPQPIIDVQSARGQVVWEPTLQRPQTIIPLEANNRMRELLVQAVESGTGRAARFGGVAAGKTGTTQDNRDAWFIGYSDEYVVGVWMGNDKGKPMTRVTGGTAPAKLWANVMRGAKSGTPIGPVGKPKMRPQIQQPSPSTPAVDKENSANDNLFDRLREKLKGDDGAA